MRRRAQKTLEVLLDGGPWLASKAELFQNVMRFVEFRQGCKLH